MVRKWKTVTEDVSVETCLDYAKSDLESLSEEMGSWRDNMEGTALENTGKYETVSECADTLEDQSSSLDDAVSNIQDLEAFDFSKTVKVTYSKPYSRSESRSTRLSHVVAYLQAAKDELQSQIDEKREKVDEIDKIENPTEEQKNEKESLDTAADDMDDQLNELDNVISELEGIEFPGMY